MLKRIIRNILNKIKTTPTFVKVGVVLLMAGIVLALIPIIAFSQELPGSDINIEDIEIVYSENKIVIPSISVDMSLFNSNSENDLYKGGWLYPKNPTPEEGGNSVIFAHRHRFLPPASNTFYHLDKLKIGDRFYVTWNEEVYYYEVSKIKIIDPTDFSVLGNTNNDQITLITCAPLFSNEQRLVVVGELISS